jgi:hypothetical protein
LTEICPATAYTTTACPAAFRPSGQSCQMFIFSYQKIPIC